MTRTGARARTGAERVESGEAARAVVFLAGPPGSGKSSAGRRACEALGLRFLDWPRDRSGVASAGAARASAGDSALLEVADLARQGRFDVVALPWELQQEAAALAACRRAGRLVGLWAHPLPAGAACDQRFVYDWDEAGRLARARRWDLADAGAATDPVPQGAAAADLRYGYDGGGERVLKTAVDDEGHERHTVYVFDSLELRRAPWVDDPNDPDASDYEASKWTEVVYLVGAGQRLARLHYDDDAPTCAGEALHVLLEMEDHLGSSSIVIDKATGELAERSTYLAYGGADSDYRPGRWNAFREDYRFTGKEEDGEVGLAYFGARFYAPTLGRWLSPDPLAVHALGGDLNVYAYVHGRVLAAVDPVGLDSMFENATLPPPPVVEEARSGGVIEMSPMVVKGDRPPTPPSGGYYIRPETFEDGMVAYGDRLGTMIGLSFGAPLAVVAPFVPFEAAFGGSVLQFLSGITTTFVGGRGAVDGVARGDAGDAIDGAVIALSGVAIIGEGFGIGPRAGGTPPPRNWRGERVTLPADHVMSPRDPPMSEPPVTERGPYSDSQRQAFLKGDAGGTGLAPHHRHQIPVRDGGVIDELPGPGHPSGNEHTAGSPSRHPSPSVFRNEPGGEALRSDEIKTHWREKGGRLVRGRSGWFDPGPGGI